jgi:leucine dehydrogenase
MNLEMVTVTDVSRHHPEAAHCHGLYEVTDPEAGLHAFIAVHDVSRGPAFGGIRRRPFRDTREAVSEVVRLAEQMTLKTAFADLPAGGGKAVILDAPHLDHALAYERLGQAIEQLGGAFVAGTDVGTEEAELAHVRRATRSVLGPKGHLYEATARGVVASAREAFDFLGLELVSGDAIESVVVGVGSVGARVARALSMTGCRLALSDIDHHRASLQAAALGAIAIERSEVLTVATKLLSPCAVSPIVTPQSLPRIRAKVVCGSQNQQLESDELAVALAERGVLYVPDFAANAGAVIEGVIRHTSTPEAADARVEAALLAIGPRVRRLLELARDEGVTPLEAALMSMA